MPVVNSDADQRPCVFDQPVLTYWVPRQETAPAPPSRLLDVRAFLAWSLFGGTRFADRFQSLREAHLENRSAGGPAS